MELEDFEESNIIFLEIKLSIRKVTGVIVKVRKLFFVNKIGITVKKTKHGTSSWIIIGFNSW